MNSQRLAPLSGIAFVVLLVAGFFVIGGSTPDLKDPAQKVIDYYTAHKNREIAAAIAVGVSIVFLGFFVASLYGRLKPAEAPGNFWSLVAVIGGTAAVAGFTAIIGVHIALIDGADKHIPGDAMVALNAIDNDNFFAFTVPLAIMLLGTAGATIKTGALPKWLGWIALVLGIGFLTPVGFAAFGLTGLWIIAASIVMSRSPAQA